MPNEAIREILETKPESEEYQNLKNSRVRLIESRMKRFGSSVTNWMLCPKRALSNFASFRLNRSGGIRS